MPTRLQIAFADQEDIVDIIRSTAVRTLDIDSLVSDLAETTRRLLCSPFTLLACKIVIGVVSAYDIHQTIKYVEYLPEMELNPVGRWLMRLDDGPVCDLQQAACFITAKFVGNFACLAIIELVSTWRRSFAAGVALVVASFQTVLLLFLLFGDT